MQLFSPYGPSRYSSGSMLTDYSFTGQRLDSETGLIYENFRYYDPLSGRFTRADTVDTNARGMDGYAYVGDNPEGRTDPTGHCWPLCTMIIGAVIGAAVSVATTAITSAVQGKPPTAGQLLQAAAVGAVTGAISGLVGPEAGPLARIAVGAVASGAGQMVGNAISGKPLMDGVVQATVTGAITGGIMEGVGALLEGPSSETAMALEEGTTCSFTFDTRVATAHGKQAIGTLHAGEKVLAYNPKTHQMELQPILHVWINHDNDLVDLTLTTTLKTRPGHGVNRQSELIHTNQKHPFFTQEQGFLSVGQIKLGMHVLRADGLWGVVTGWKIVPGSRTMYNLEVAQDHTFTVGVDEWVVHNDCAANSTSGNNPFAQRGNQFHYDQANGGPGQLQAIYPQTDFLFKPRGAAGADVEVIGGVHPSNTTVYPGSTWYPGSDFGDFKTDNPLYQPGKFLREISSGKLPPGTVPIWFDPIQYIITRIG